MSKIYTVFFDSGSGLPSFRGIATGELEDIEKYYNPKEFTGLLIEEEKIFAVPKGYAKDRVELESALDENLEVRDEIIQAIEDLG